MTSQTLLRLCLQPSEDFTAVKTEAQKLEAKQPQLCQDALQGKTLSADMFLFC